MLLKRKEFSGIMAHQDGHYQGKVSCSSREYVTISYDGRQIIAGNGQLDGLRLQKGQPVIFAIKDGQLINLDIDGSSLPRDRQTGRIVRFNPHKDIGTLVGDDGMEAFFSALDTRPLPHFEEGSAVSYILRRGRYSVKAYCIRRA